MIDNLDIWNAIGDRRSTWLHIYFNICITISIDGRMSVIVISFAIKISKCSGYCHMLIWSKREWQYEEREKREYFNSKCNSNWWFDGRTAHSRASTAYKPDRKFLIVNNLSNFGARRETPTNVNAYESAHKYSRMVRLVCSNRFDRTNEMRTEDTTIKVCETGFFDFIFVCEFRRSPPSILGGSLSLSLSFCHLLLLRKYHFDLTIMWHLVFHLLFDNSNRALHPSNEARTKRDVNGK